MPMDQEIIIAIVSGIGGVGGAVVYGIKKFVDVKERQVNHELEMQKKRFDHEKAVSQTLIDQNQATAQCIVENTVALRALQADIQDLAKVMKTNGITGQLREIRTDMKRLLTESKKSQGRKGSSPPES